MLNNYELEVDFLADGAIFIRGKLQELEYSVSEAETLEQVSLKYFNLLKKLIPPYPREVLISNNFSCPPGYEKGLEIIKHKTLKGEDLRLHLSKEVTNLKYNDLLLNDWGIHHLHLGTTLNKYGLIERTCPVLFARFDKDKAFFIDILDHGRGVPKPWIKQHLIRILHDNWHDSIENFHLSRIKGLTYVPSDTDIDKLRKAGIQTAVQLEEGIVYSSLGGGYSTSGISTDVRIQSDCWIRSLKNWEKYVKDNYLLLLELAQHQGITFSPKLKFHLRIEEDQQVYVLEEGAQVQWQICDRWFPYPGLSGY